MAVVRLPGIVRSPKQEAVRLARFRAFEAGGSRRLPAGIRVFGGRQDAGTGTPAFPVSENLEPEYVAVDGDSRTAYVSLQEANGVAVVDLSKAKVERIWSLGTVDRQAVPMDASDADGAVNIASWPVRGYRMPDALATYEVEGRTYLVAAEEGDSRDWEGYSEVARVKDLGEDGLPPICPGFDTGSSMTVQELVGDANLGRLNITTANGLNPAGTCFERLYTYGGRGFSIWTPRGKQVSGSGDRLERITARAAPAFFNSTHTESGFDGRSDDKGPEPEGLALGRVGGRDYAFVGLERVGGVMAFDVSRPERPRFMTYVNNRDFTFSGEGAASGDLGPEGLDFIPRAESPTRRAMVAVGNEVSGSTTLFKVRQLEPGS